MGNPAMSIEVLRERLRDIRDEDVTAGSQTPEGAWPRATAVMRFAPKADLEFWRGQATQVLMLYLHAAALGGKPLARVRDWTSSGQDVAVQDEIRALLGTSDEADTVLSSFDQWCLTAPHTAAAIRSTMSSALDRFQNADPTDPDLRP
jgi:hypothetical protein